MKDLQASPDTRGVPLEHVGVTRVPLPIRVKQKAGGHQKVRAVTNLFVEVPGDVRGTHLSRLVEALMEWAEEPVDSLDIERLLERTVESCDSLSAEVDILFSYFIQKAAPVTKRVGYMNYECEFRGRYDDGGFHFILGAKVPVTTLCPCSKEISDRGAHNQRSTVAVEVSYQSETNFIWLEDLVATVEAQASCAVFPILKRPDEKYVTEKAYDNPKFVEDVVRDVILSLRNGNPGLTWLSVECESEESIHGHNAYAASKCAVRQETDSLRNAPRSSVPEPHRQLSRSLR
jgi:GTP cyclohydrolase I